MNDETKTGLNIKKHNELSIVNRRGDRPLIRKFCSLHQLNYGEISALRKLHEHTIAIDGHRIFLNQGDIYKKCVIVNQGWAYRYNSFSNGKQQIISYYLPGDIISPLALVMPKISYSVCSISRIEASVFKPEALMELFSLHPKLGLLFGYMLAREDSIIAEQVARLGCRSAYQRTAHLLLEMFHRLKVIGKTEQYSFTTPLTQQLMADTLGLSLVHMNRTLHKLRHENLISIESNKISLLDIDKLEELTEYPVSDFESIENVDQSSSELGANNGQLRSASLTTATGM